MTSEALQWSCFSPFFTYPSEEPDEALQELETVLLAHSEDVYQTFLPFKAFWVQSDLSAQEEAYVRAFDFNPESALEVGWHLFGEDYARGDFLVKMRQLLHQYQIPESTELPDHLTSVLQVLEHLGPEDAGLFAEKNILPALQKVSSALASKENPYLTLCQTLEQLLQGVFSIASKPLSESPFHGALSPEQAKRTMLNQAQFLPPKRPTMTEVPLDG